MQRVAHGIEKSVQTRVDIKHSCVRFYQCKSCTLNILYAIFVVIMFQKSNFFSLIFRFKPWKGGSSRHSLIKIWINFWVETATHVFGVYYSFLFVLLNFDRVWTTFLSTTFSKITAFFLSTSSTTLQQILKQLLVSTTKIKYRDLNNFF